MAVRFQYLNNMRNGIQQVDQFRVTIISNATLTSKMVVIGWDESTEWQTALRTVPEQIYNVVTQLSQLLTHQRTAAQLRLRTICQRKRQTY
jgi:hypothetical protein